MRGTRTSRSRPDRLTLELPIQGNFVEREFSHLQCLGTFVTSFGTGKSQVAEMSGNAKYSFKKPDSAMVLNLQRPVEEGNYEHNHKQTPGNCTTKCPQL